MSSISICMIVKDEGKALPGCLENIKGIYDELIIVDTGSSDNTVEIAEKNGAKIYNFEWQDHFGKARNFSFSKANSKWIFYIDADERMSESLKEHLKSLIDTEEDIVYRIPIVDEILKYASGTSIGPIRLFRKDSFKFDEKKRGHTQRYHHNCVERTINYPIIHCQRENHWLVNPVRILPRILIDVQDFPKTKSSLYYFVHAFVRFWYFFIWKIIIKKRGFRDGWLGWKFGFMKGMYQFNKYIFIGLKPKNQSVWEKWINKNNE